MKDSHECELWFQSTIVLCCVVRANNSINFWLHWIYILITVGIYQFDARNGISLIISCGFDCIFGCSFGIHCGFLVFWILIWCMLLAMTVIETIVICPYINFSFLRAVRQHFRHRHNFIKGWSYPIYALDRSR